MGEYKGEDARTKFMGANPGYVGFGQVSTIYSEVMMRPYSVVVLDEFEKAHPSLSDLLISMLDGAADDAQGRRVDFSQCVFVLTSNSLHADRVGDDDDVRRTLVDLGGIWTEPFVDRLDRIVHFEPLSKAALQEILQLMIDKRNASAAHPLPSALENDQTQTAIVDAAMSGGGHGSARRLERALMTWLRNYVDESSEGASESAFAVNNVKH